LFQDGQIALHLELSVNGGVKVGAEQNQASLRHENHIIGGRGCLDVRGGQIGIVAEIEVCGSVFDLGDDELLDRIEADRAEPDASSAAAATSVSGKTSISRSAWMNSRLPRLPMRDSSSRRRC
jgi:hypothetical protein